MLSLRVFFFFLSIHFLLFSTHSFSISVFSPFPGFFYISKRVCLSSTVFLVCYINASCKFCVKYSFSLNLVWSHYKLFYKMMCRRGWYLLGKNYRLCHRYLVQSIKLAWNIRNAVEGKLNTF